MYSYVSQGTLYTWICRQLLAPSSFPSFTNRLSNDESDIFLADYLILSEPAFQSEHIRHFLQKHLGEPKGKCTVGTKIARCNSTPGSISC